MSTSVPPPGWAEPAVPDPAFAPSIRRRRPPKPLTAGALLAVVAALVFLLLGSSGSGLTGPIAQAAALSSSTPGYRMQIAMQMTSPALNGPIAATGNTIVDSRDHALSMDLAMNLGSVPQVIQALGGDVLHLHMVFGGGAVYVRLPDALAAKMPFGGKPWVEINLSKLGNIPGLSSLNGDPAMSDPSRVMDYLSSEAVDVTRLGREPVDGLETTHYHADLSLERIAAKLPSAYRSALSSMAGSELVPVDVWIDSRHLLRRVELTLSTVAFQERMKIDVGDYGPQPAPAIPPSSQVRDLSGLIRGG